LLSKDSPVTGHPVKLAVALAIVAALALGCAAMATAATDTARAADHAAGREPPIYWSTIRTTIAHAFHRTPRQLANLWGADGKNSDKRRDPIAAYATRHGVAIAALRALDLRAIQLACNALIQQHYLTAAEVSQRLSKIRSAPLPDLDSLIMTAFRKPQFQ
jgi:hypothetical protein